MIGLITLEVYNSVFNITEENIKFEIYTDTFDGFSFTEIKDELEEMLTESKTTFEHLPTRRNNKTTYNFNIKETGNR